MKRLRLLLVLDTTLLIALAILMVPRSSLGLHEWLGLAVVAAVILHLLFAWQWMSTALQRLGAKGAWRLRVNILLNVLLFITFVVTLYSGVMASVIAVPALGIVMPDNTEGWKRLHNEWSDYLQLLAGLHLAMNWGWIVGTVRRQLLKRPNARGDAAIALVAAEPKAAQS